ncbi:amidase [Austwickia chelonae]|uniref:Putative amidase n=1 Tax=Austwickia chelonae NBRC 105200 TaxID=1184607 RepID=K6UML8_9MICO|nr:amidase family protein [Austwickia chelonae]GAB78226.1 putative amidase [Austwickia chelonae NBRC 105200]SEV99086.1 amidase [Austwickia chelonae]
MPDAQDCPQEAVSIARAVHSGRCTARAVTDASLSRIMARDPALHAVEQVFTGRARAEADAVDARPVAVRGALAGVPVAVKAENRIAGVVTTHGGRTGSSPSEVDSEVVGRLRTAGAVLVATTRMPELGLFPFTEGDWGATVNPWRTTHSPGGSSGGSAVAVASGMVPVAIGSDGGGSIRIPSSACGLVGLKPVRGRVSTAPSPDLWGPLGTIGVMSRTVADSALVYDAVRGSTRVDRYAAPEPGESFGQAAAREPGSLRIGWFTRSPWPGVRVDPRICRLLAETVDVLAAAGHRMVRLDGRWPDSSRSFTTLYYAGMRASLRQVEHPDLAEARTREVARSGSWVRPLVRLSAIKAAGRLAKRVRSEFSEYDLLLTPTLAALPPRVGQLSAVGAARSWQRSLPFVAFTTLANVTGHAAVCLPAGTIEGLPVGVQFYAPGGDETRLFPIASQWERLRPWPRTASAGGGLLL